MTSIKHQTHPAELAIFVYELSLGFRVDFLLFSLLQNIPIFKMMMDNLNPKWKKITKKKDFVLIEIVSCICSSTKPHTYSMSVQESRIMGTIV